MMMMFITIIAKGLGPERDVENRFICAKKQRSKTGERENVGLYYKTARLASMSEEPDVMFITMRVLCEDVMM